jgi:membrane protein DedA with SNARE-associated domain
VSLVDVSSWFDELEKGDPTVILLVIGSLALLENAAFVGVLVPGEASVLLGGALAATGAVDIVALGAVVAVAATVGDSIGYSLGRTLGPRLDGSRVERLIGRHRLAAARTYMHDRGARAVFFGRFVAVVRTAVPFLAGAGRMPYRSFLAWNAIGALIWSVVHVGVGAAVGASLERAESTMSAMSVVLVVVVAAVIVRQRHRRIPARAPRFATTARDRDDVEATGDRPPTSGADRRDAVHR